MATKPYRQYTGQIFYGVMGNMIHEVGTDRPAEAEKTITKAAKALDGRWAFGVRKQMVQKTINDVEKWETWIVFVDGKKWKLRAGELAPTDAVPRRQWIPASTVMSILGDRPGYQIKQVPQKTVRTGREAATTLRREFFDDMEAFEKFCNTLPPKKRIFVYEPNEAEKAPEGEGLVIYIGVEH